MPASLPFPNEALPDLLRTLLAVSLTGVAVVQPVVAPEAPADLADLRGVYLNPAAQRLLRQPEQPAHTLLQLYPEATDLLRLCRRAWHTGAPVHLELPYQRDGVAARLRVAAQRSGDLLLLSLEDTLGQPTPDEVQRALRASETRELAAYAEANRQREQLYHVLEQAPAMICVFDGPQHVFQLVNPPYQALVGPRPLLGLPIAEAMPELAGQPIFTLLDEVYRTGETFHANEMLVQLDHDNEGRPELEKRYYNFTYQPRRTAAGLTNGIFVFAHDVTAQVLARQQVQALNEELEARVAARTRELEAARAAAERQRRQLDRLFMQAPAAICVLDGPELVYQLVNPSYQQAFPGRQLQGKPLLAALPELLDSPIPGLLAQVYSTGESYVAHALPLQLARTDDSPLEQLYWTFTYQARRNDEGVVDGVLVFAYDVTDQVRARQSMEASQRRSQALTDELRHANAQLTRTNADLDNFIYTASHDLKAPISNLEGLLQVLRLELALPPGQADAEPVLHLMHDSIQRFQRTISYLTDVSKLQKAFDQPATPVALAELVESVRLDLAPLLTATGGELLVDLSGCTTVAFAEKNLRSIVYNLLSNALKYRSPERAPRVRVQCHGDARTTVLEVHDNGLGLDPEQQQKLFGMFQRLHDHVDGSGIGLYMVKKIVENAGGTVEVESQPGRGSIFRVRLPAVPLPD